MLLNITVLSGTIKVPPDIVLLNITVLSGTWERKPAAGVTAHHRV